MKVFPVPVPAPRYFTKCRVPGIYLGIYPIFQVFTLHKGRVRVWDVVPEPRVLWHGRTEATELAGTGMKVIHAELTEVPRTEMSIVQNLQKFFA